MAGVLAALIAAVLGVIAVLGSAWVVGLGMRAMHLGPVPSWAYGVVYLLAIGMSITMLALAAWAEATHGRE